MATITNVDPISVQQLSSNNWKLTVTYEANFSNEEIQKQYNFRDSFAIREDDSVYDDKLPGPHDVGTFKPSAKTVKRTLTTQVKGDVLNTEAGAEEIYVVIYLENVDLNVKFPTQKKQDYQHIPVVLLR